MSTKYKKLKNNALTKAKQTRTEQVNAKAKKYNKKISKSDEAYINGNIRQASAMRAYGIKQARAKGEEVYGYSKDDVYKARKNQLTVGKEINKDKAKYLYTNKKTTVPGGTRKDGSTYDSFTSRKRMLTDDEKTSLSKYGDLYDNNKESKQYKWMDSSKKDAKNLLEHMNTFRMDGMKTAKARAREEKGLGKLKEYGTGLAKDILIDPLVDTLRVADTVGGSLTGAGLGALENLDNLMKGYELDKDLISNNFKSSIKSSNETGWSKSSSEVLREREERQFLKDKEYYNNDEIMKKMYGTSDLEQHKKNIEKGTKYAGFIWDIIGDPTDIVNVAGKNLLKNTAKSGKELLTGTADISTAFKSKHLDDIFFSSKPYEDLKIFDDSGAGKIHSQLDNAYDRSVANDVREKVVQKVSTSSQKPFLASFLDELNNNSPLEGKQLKIDGRTLNKKYTQLKNPVEPYKVQEVNPSFNNPNKYVQEKQYDMFSKDYQNNLDEAYEEGLRKYEDFLDDDLTTDKMTDDMYDYLENNHPNYYKNLTGESDVIQEHIGNNKEVKWLSDNYTKQYENIEKKAKKERKFDAKKNEELEVENAVEQLLNIFDKKKTKVKNSKIRKFEFSHNIKDLSDKIVKGEFTNDDISQITKKLKGDSITKEVKRQQVNNLLFGGKEVLTKNVTSKNIDELLTSIEEIVSMKNAKDWYNETGEITKFKLSASTRKMLDIPNNKKVTVEDLDVDKLVQLLNNKSRSYTDNRYYEKLELLARVHEYDKIENVRNRVKEIDKEFKILDKKPLSQEVIKAKTDLSKEKKLLKKKIDDRDKHWKQIRDLTENDFDKYISENYNQHMKGMNPYKHNTSKYKEIKNMDNLDGYKEALDETSSIRRNQKLTYDDIRDEVLHEIKNYSEHKGVNYSKKDINDLVNTRWEDYKNSLSDMKKSEDIQNRNATNVYNPKKGMDDLSQSPRLEQENLESVGEFDFKLSNQIKSLRKQLNLPNITPPKAKIKLTKGQKLHEIPPAKDSLKGLRSVIEKELDFMNKKPNEYAGMEQAFKEIKKSYVNTLRQIGIRDEQYFHKVKALQDDLKLYYQTLKEPKKVKSDSPLVKMNLQALARRISETFDELDNVVIDSVKESPIQMLGDVITNPGKLNDPFASDFEIFNNSLNELDNKKVLNNVKKEVKKVEKPSSEEIDKILSKYSDVNTERLNLEDVPLDMSKYPGVNEDGVVEEILNNFPKSILEKIPTNKSKTKEKNNFFNKMFQENNGEKLGYEDNEIYNVYKRWLNSYKKSHTVYNPGWHVQNYFQNKGQNYLELGMDAFAPQTKAKNLLHEIKGKSNKAQDTYGKYSKNEIIDFIKQNGVVDGLGEDVINSNGIFPKLETSIDNSGFMKKLGESEQTARLHHFLTQLERGKSMEESLKSVNDTLFDYSKKTNLDKVISDFVDPFWVFHKNNAKLIGKSAIKNSDKFSRLDRGLRNLGEPGEDGKRGTGHKFVDDVNKDEYEYRYKQQILPDARESLNISDGDIENKLNPLLQLAIKHSKGEGNFGNKIVDGEANWGEITKDEAIKEALLDVNPFMPQLVKFINNAIDKKDRSESGKQSEETSNKQILHDFITFITGNKGNYYRQH